MREIKFHGKRKDTGEWIEGDLRHWKTGEVAIVPINFGLEPIAGYAVDTSTVGQYTGLKDKNGKEIYEGNKLLYVTTNSMSDMVVKFIDGCFVGEGPFNARPLIEYIKAPDFESIEVIGDIHDNPELLKGAE